MDSDLQDSPLAIPRFVAAWRDGCDVVYAMRASRKEALWKRLLFAGFHRLLARMSHGRIPVDAGNFSLMDRRVVGHILALEERDRYLPGLRSWVGFRQRGIEVERQARYDGRPRVSLLGLWRLAKTAMFSFSTFPLAVFYVIGYSALAIFLVLAAYSLYCRLFTDLAIPGWTSHILSASFFGALNALGISILGEYVARIYDQVRGRPVYVVERTVNADGRHVQNEWHVPEHGNEGRGPSAPPRLSHLSSERATRATSEAGQGSAENLDVLKELARLIAMVQTSQTQGVEPNQQAISPKD
jgi:dolichol-phosphate mannosyltransferase